MLRKVLIVGVGGSGGKTLWVLRDELERAIRARGWPAGRDFPECWQFLHIDTPKVVSEGSSDFPPPLPNSQYLGLARPGVEYRELDEILCREDAAKDVVAGWRPDDPLSVTVPLQQGAGQFRAIGAMTLQYGIKEVAQTISERVGLLFNTKAQAHIDDLNVHFNATSTAGNTDPLVMVVGSIAGGSGSGLFLDVCDILRLALRSETKSKIFGVLFAPDTFTELEGKMTGVHGNALSAMAELLAGSINTGVATKDEVSLLMRGGLSDADRLIRRGPDVPFLVGRANAHVEFADAEQVFRSVGRALTVWLTDENVQNDMISYTTGNAMQAAANTPTDVTGISPTVKGVLSSFGHASVGLARDQFRRYASDRLAAATVAQLRERHQADTTVGKATDREIFESKVEEAFRVFREDAHLWEVGDEKGDIENALFDRMHFENALQRAHSEVYGSIELNESMATRVQQLATTLGDQARDRQPEFELDQSRRLNSASAAWIEDVQEGIAVATTKVVARYGFRVAAAAVSRMIEELQAVIETEFKPKRIAGLKKPFEEIFLQGRRGESTQTSVQPARGGSKGSKTTKGPGGGLTGFADSVQKRVKEALKTAWGTPFEHVVYDRAVALTSDLVESLLKPLAAELDRQERDLRLSCRGTLERPSLFDVWDRATRGVPRLLRPAQNQLLLEELDEFPAVYDKQLQNTTSESDPSTAEKSAIGRLFLKGPDEMAEPKFISYQQRWVPKGAEDYLGKSSQPARFIFQTDLEDLHRRVSRWVETPGERIGDYCGETLADYLQGGSSKTEREARIDLFRDRFRQVFGLAAPMARLSPTGMSLVHKLKADSEEVKSAITRLPFEEAHPARAIAEEVLKERGYGTAVSAMFDDTNMAQTIEVATVFGRPYNPFVFSSFVSPIEATIKQLRLTGSHGDFWKWRRTRQLPRAIVLDPSYRRAMIQGWWLARMIGQVQGVDEETYGRKAIAIWTGDGWAAFPFPLLARPRSIPEVLPTLLESMPLAIIDAVTLNSEDPLKPYRRLLHLGGGGDAHVEDDPSLPEEFEEWLSSGKTPSGASNQLFGDAANAADRTSGVVTYLEEALKYYSEERFPSVERDLTKRVPPDWELRHDIFSVLHTLGQRCSDRGTRGRVVWG